MFKSVVGSDSLKSGKFAGLGVGSFVETLA
jgi:hypothetical protein